jgi:hypothetical protein
LLGEVPAESINAADPAGTEHRLMATSNLPLRRAGKTGLRHVWLAGLGVVSVLRRGVINANHEASLEASRLERRAVDLADRIKSQMIAGAESARVHLDPIVLKAKERIGHQVASTLDKIGLPSSSPRAGHTTAPRTTRRAATASSRRTRKG